jgi:multimeric flavodoxin WrbA
MKALLLNGILKDDPDFEMISSSIIELLEGNGFETEQIILKNVKVTPCQGCFECWVKTPGECKTDDNGRAIAKKIVQSNLIIHFTPIIFGGYSSELKKVLDRFIPTILPFFTSRNRETHHKYRYDNRGSIIAVGVMDKPDEEKEATFKELVYRNSLNMGAPVHKAIVYIKNQNTNAFLSEFSHLLKKVEERV